MIIAQTAGEDEVFHQNGHFFLVFRTQGEAFHRIAHLHPDHRTFQPQELISPGIIIQGTGQAFRDKGRFLFQNFYLQDIQDRPARLFSQAAQDPYPPAQLQAVGAVAPGFQSAGGILDIDAAGKIRIHIVGTGGHQAFHQIDTARIPLSDISDGGDLRRRPGNAQQIFRNNSVGIAKGPGMLRLSQIDILQEITAGEQDLPFRCQNRISRPGFYQPFSAGDRAAGMGKDLALQNSRRPLRSGDFGGK